MSTSFQGVFGTYLYVIKCSPVCSSLSCVFWEYYSAQLTVNCSTHFRPWISKKHVLRFNNNHATTSAYVRKNTNYYNCKGSYVDGKQENHYHPFPLKHSFPIWIILQARHKDNFKENCPKRKSCLWQLLENQVPICAGYTQLFDL